MPDNLFFLVDIIHFLSTAFPPFFSLIDAVILVIELSGIGLNPLFPLQLHLKMAAAQAQSMIDHPVLDNSSSLILLFTVMGFQTLLQLCESWALICNQDHKLVQYLS